MKRIVLHSTYNGNVAGRRMKVRNDSKTKTNMLVLAKGKAVWNDSTMEIVSEAAKFGSYDLKQALDGSWEYTTKCKIIKQSDKFGMSTDFDDADVLQNTNNFLRNILLFKGIGFAEIEREMKLFDCDTRPAKLRNISDKLGRFTTRRDEIAAMAEFYANDLAVSASFQQEIVDIDAAIILLKQELGYWKVVKPFVSYNVGTQIRYNTDGDDNQLRQDEVYHMSTITIKKVYRNRINVMGKQEDDCRIIFDSKCFDHLKLWVQSFKVIS